MLSHILNYIIKPTKLTASELRIQQLSAQWETLTVTERGSISISPHEVRQSAEFQTSLERAKSLITKQSV